MCHYYWSCVWFWALSLLVFAPHPYTLPWRCFCPPANSRSCDSYLNVYKPVYCQTCPSKLTVNNFTSDVDNIIFIRETQMVMNPGAATDSMPLLQHEQESTSYHVALSPSVVELNPPEALHCERGVGDNDALPDIHGKQLWLTPDFYLVLVIMAICEWPVQKTSKT